MVANSCTSYSMVDPMIHLRLQPSFGWRRISSMQHIPPIWGCLTPSVRYPGGKAKEKSTWESAGWIETETRTWTGLNKSRPIGILHFIPFHSISREASSTTWDGLIQILLISAAKSWEIWHDDWLCPTGRLHACNMSIYGTHAKGTWSELTICVTSARGCAEVQAFQNALDGHLSKQATFHSIPWLYFRLSKSVLCVILSENNTQMMMDHDRHVSHSIPFNKQAFGIPHIEMHVPSQDHWRHLKIVDVGDIPWSNTPLRNWHWGSQINMSKAIKRAMKISNKGPCQSFRTKT